MMTMNITRYETKPYTGTRKFIDIEKFSQPPL